MSLQQAQADLDLAAQHLTAIGVLMAVALYALGDRLKAQGREAKAHRRAQRQARKAAQGAR